MIARNCRVLTFQAMTWDAVNSEIKSNNNALKRFLHLSCARLTATIINGKEIANEVVMELQRDVRMMLEDGLERPQLAALLVGNDAVSHLYLRKKIEASKTVGISCTPVIFPENVTEEVLVHRISSLGEDPDVHGILVQLPLPKHIDEYVVSSAIAPHKDVDGVNLVNVGRLYLGLDSMVPCTALGVREVIHRMGITTKGKHAVVCGRSANVGMPIALLLQSDKKRNSYGMDATTTVCHRFTPPEDLSRLTRTADILISATGVQSLITKGMVKEGACVIDVGITRHVDPHTGKSHLCGDVDFEGVKDKVRYITPVPGGVGPMTVAMLMKNTVLAAKRKLQYDVFSKTQLYHE